MQIKQLFLCKIENIYNHTFVLNLHGINMFAVGKLPLKYFCLKFYFKKKKKMLSSQK